MRVFGFVFRVGDGDPVEDDGGHHDVCVAGGEADPAGFFAAHDEEGGEVGDGGEEGADCAVEGAAGDLAQLDLVGGGGAEGVEVGEGGEEESGEVDVDDDVEGEEGDVGDEFEADAADVLVVTVGNAAGAC